MTKLKILISLILISYSVNGQFLDTTKWSLHIQNTTVFQTYPQFSVKYSGDNSLMNSNQSALSNTTTIFIKRNLWRNATFHIDQETTAGGGLSGAKGLAGFTNGEIYRVGSPKPTPFIARAYYQQTFKLKDSSLLNIIIGKFCLSDFFDNNKYNHDARSQFLNWSIMAQGAWDFPGDIRGYTTGVVIEYIKPKYTLRFSSVEVPKIANALPMEYKFNGAHGETIEYETHWKTGVIRTTGYITFCRAPYYQDAINLMKNGDSSLNPIIGGLVEGTKYYGAKYGFGINLEQEVLSNVGLFSRYSWNDGHTATWAFTEIDRSFQVGVEINHLKRKNDVIGIAQVINGLSSQHKQYLSSGGYGFLIGDGKLNYGTENIFETYYRYYFNRYIQSITYGTLGICYYIQAMVKYEE